MTKPQSLLLIGCGNMGGALLKGWMHSAVGEEVVHLDVVKPSPPSDDIAFDGVTFHTHLDTVENQPTIVVWGVKPFQLEQVIPRSIEKFGVEPLYISIAAGKTLDNLQSYAEHDDVKLVRAMPNTPVSANVGITGLCATDNLSEDDEAWAESLFASVGIAAWIDEAQMNALTALCGSGPAYVYYFMECLKAAAENLGIESDAADMLTRQMLLGASELAVTSDEGIATLRENVTSPNGVTEAALKVWMQEGTLDTQAMEALKAAVARAEEMES